MIDALIAGRLYGQPQQRTARNGSPYTTAKLRVALANGETAFVNVITFRESVGAALLALSDGAPLALAGELKAGAYTAQDGTARASLDLTAHEILTEYHVTRRRKAMQRDETQACADA